MSYFHVGKPHTIIGAERFHFRVRDGIGWFPLAITARQKLSSRNALLLCSTSHLAMDRKFG